MNIERALLGFGTVVAAVLLGRFAIDFGTWMPAWLAVPAWLLVVVTLFVAGRNALRASPTPTPTPTPREITPLQRGSLLTMAPLAFVGSSLDCMGLSLGGCTTTCALLKVTWFPVFVAACAIAAFTTKRRALTAVIALSFVSLVPHCVCRNPVNAWWMDRLGSSPMCLGWGFVASLVALGALARRSHVRSALGVSGAITGGTMAFFVGHHFFRFPW
jgi:hypothetical protein